MVSLDWDGRAQLQTELNTVRSAVRVRGLERDEYVEHRRREPPPLDPCVHIRRQSAVECRARRVSSPVRHTIEGRLCGAPDVSPENADRSEVEVG
jgi:hypothetical protein